MCSGPSGQSSRPLCPPSQGPSPPAPWAVVSAAEQAGVAHTSGTRVPPHRPTLLPLESISNWHIHWRQTGRDPWPHHPGPRGWLWCSPLGLFPPCFPVNNCWHVVCFSCRRVTRYTLRNSTSFFQLLCCILRSSNRAQVLSPSVLGPQAAPRSSAALSGGAVLRILGQSHCSHRAPSPPFRDPHSPTALCLFLFHKNALIKSGCL